MAALSGLVLGSPTSTEHACPTSGLLCGRLAALLESVLRPGGLENMCRLTCYCVRHISLDNKHGRPVKARHSFLSRCRAGTELCAGKQEEPCGKKSSMGSENRQRCSRRFRTSVMVRSVPPRFDRAGPKTRRALVAFLRLSACCRLGKSRFCKISQRDPTSARSFLERSYRVMTES